MKRLFVLTELVQVDIADMTGAEDPAGLYALALHAICGATLAT
jgi:hypothetical protein